MQSTPTTWLSKKNLLGLVYVGIAVGLIVNGAYFTQANAQWLTAATQLDAKVFNSSFNLTGGPMPIVIVNASLENPTDRGDINLVNVEYQIFVNSTGSSFSVQGSSVVATGQVFYGKPIPAQSSINITAAVRIITDTVAHLTNFLQPQNHIGPLRIFVGIILRTQSSYISITMPNCTELPGRIQTICPALRAQTSGGGGA